MTINRVAKDTPHLPADSPNSRVQAFLRRHGSSFERHLLEKQTTRDWLPSCLAGKSQMFPYALRTTALGQPLLEKVLYPPVFPKKSGSSNPRFVVTMPMGGSWNRPHVERVMHLIARVRDQAFGQTAEESAVAVRRDLALVIGLNSPVSLDPKRNRRFSQMLDFPRSKQIPHAVLGFFWEPKWKPTQQGTLLPKEKAFLLLKAFSPEVARQVRNIREGEKRLSQELQDQIPYQKIREVIKNAQSTQHFVHFFSSSRGEPPIYLAIVDEDFQNLRNPLGFFSRMQQVLREHQEPFACSLGYRIEDPNQHFLSMGVALDMRVRAAMNGVVFGSGYLPEPGSVFRLKKSGPQGNPLELLRALSFQGGGRKLENRRLLESARKLGLIGGVFLPEGGVATAIPRRMLKQTNQTLRGSPLEQIRAMLKRPSTLQMLRSVSQTHVHPKQWAEDLYAVLSFSCSRVTDATQPMMEIFKLFDPISRMQALHPRFSPEQFDRVLAEYERPLTPVQVRRLCGLEKRLVQLGMSPQEVQKVTRAAQDSGRAIRDFLQEEAR